MAATLRNTGVICSLIMFVGLSLYAQTPQKMSYQAVVRDGTGDLVVSETVGMKISIVQGSVAGTAVYVETHTPTTNANGLVTLSVGMGSVVTGVFASINWANGPYFIKTETDPAGGTSYTISGTSELLSVPYALHAETAATAGALAFADFYALMPPDNAATVAVGGTVNFPQNGPAGGGIIRTSNSSFLLPESGVYQVFFQVSVNEAGQLVLSLDNVDVPSTVVGRATGTSQIVGLFIITAQAGSELSVKNPSGNSTALSITPLAGGTNPVSAHLVITRIK